MSTPPVRRQYGAGKILLLVFGSLFVLLALGLFAAGSVATWADRTQRDGAGYISTSTERVDSGSYAVVARDINVEVPGWMTGADRLGKVRVTATPATAGAQLFVGIAHVDQVDAYLAGVDRDLVSAWHGGSHDIVLDHRSGSAPSTPPGAQTFWTTSSSGAGAQTVTWTVVGGNWAVVAMNADASRGLTFDAAGAATAPFLLGLGIGLLLGGLFFAILGSFMVVLGARRAGPQPAYATGYGQWAPPPPAPPAPGAPQGAALAAAEPPRYTVYPVALTGHLDEPLNRWLWLVKWVLVIPHYFVLALLSVPFVLLTIVAWFAILFTGRYPRAIFDFNLGVLRWGWRVSFYAYSALGTDRYPPFSLDEEPDYPARLDIAYPERLSRGLVLVKSWLLAIPHLVIVGLLTGGVGIHGWPWGVGVIGALVFVAGVLLLVTERYNRDIFDLVMGLDRWVVRVLAYVALMRDEYPPFRLDLGENEPELAGTAPSAPMAPPAPQAPQGT